MKTAIWTILVGGILLVSLPEKLAADTIYTNFGPGDTFDTTVSWTVGGNGFGVGQNVGGSFRVGPTNMLFDSAQIAVFYSFGPPSLTLGIYSNDGSNLPGSLLQSLTVTNVFKPNVPLVVTFKPTAPLILEANTTYWLASAEPLTSAFGWYFNNTSQFGVAVNQNQGPWSFKGATNATPAFRINGTPEASPVPEPASLTLVAIGLTSLLSFRGLRNRSGHRVPPEQNR